MRSGTVFYTSIIRMIKLRRMKWAGHVARMGEILVGKPEGKKKESVGGWTILKWILER
jgi:hypothetical protein